MISTTAAFDAQIQKDSRTFRARLLSDNIPISGEIKKITINKGACGEFAIGSIYSSYIEVTLDNCEEQLENEELQLRIGLVIDGSVEYINIGYYTVTKPEASAYSTTFTAVGRITSKLNKLFDVPAVLTLRNIANAITVATGVNIVFNGEVSDAVLAKDMTGMTCKEALSVIASTFGGFATEDNSGNIVVSKYNTDSKISVDCDRMTALPEFNDYDYVLNGIKVVVSAKGETEDGSTIEEVAFTNGTPRFTMTNEFMTAELFEKFVANTVGYTYRPGIVPLALGDPRLQPWDCLEVTDIKGNVHVVPCLNIVHTFDGGLSTTITAPGESESESVSNVAGPVTQQLEKLNALLVTAQEAILKRLIAKEIIADDITGATGNFTKYLTGVRIIGDLIEANTLKANTLILQGEDGIYRRLNIDALGQAVVDSDPKYNQGIDGSVLVKESITADKINVTDLFAQNITATGSIRGLSIIGGTIMGTLGKIGAFKLSPSGLESRLSAEAIYDWSEMDFAEGMEITTPYNYTVGRFTDFYKVDSLTEITFSAEGVSLGDNIPTLAYANSNGRYGKMEDISDYKIQLIEIRKSLIDGGYAYNIRGHDITTEPQTITVPEAYDQVAFGIGIYATGMCGKDTATSLSYASHYLLWGYDTLYPNYEYTVQALVTTIKPRVVIKGIPADVSINPFGFKYGGFFVNNNGDVFLDDSELEALWAENVEV